MEIEVRKHGQLTDMVDFTTENSEDCFKLGVLSTKIPSSKTKVSLLENNSIMRLTTDFESIMDTLTNNK